MGVEGVVADAALSFSADGVAAAAVDAFLVER